MMPEMPSAKRNTKNYFLVDALYWADNGTELGEMYEAMKAGGRRACVQRQQSIADPNEFG
jgi:hypothetical protein